MRDFRINRLLAGTALGVSLVLTAHSALAQSEARAEAKSDEKIEAAVPMPATADLPPLTAKDVGPPAAATPPADSAATPAATPAAPVAPAAIASPLGEKLRDLVTGKSDRILSRKADRAGVEAFYGARNYEPLWITKDAANERAKAAIAYLAGVDRDGLVPADYPAPDFQAASGIDALAEAELRLTASVLTYARHVQTGRVNFTRVSSDIVFTPVAPEPADVLAKLAETKDVGQVLDGFSPPQPAYKALKAKLAELRKGEGIAKKEDMPVVPAGPTLKPGMKDKRVTVLRERLKLEGDRSNETYDDAVAEAVKKFQKEEGLGVDGAVGPNTLARLNGRQVTADPIDMVIVNMDRWRWLPRDLGSPYVMVNVPDYTLKVVKEGKTLWSTKIVVGKPVHATPLITADMKFITVNPTWNVPPSIIENEYLPALAEDPMALERIGLKIEQAPDGTVRIYQPPGAGNALGRIRFNFPNKFLVYQHDTNEKHYFARDKRAYSHGCMRVQDPLKYGEVLLSLALPGENYTQARIEKMFGGSEININFPTPIPVHLTYQSAFVDDDGKLQLREDVYGRDARMMALMKDNERRVADIAVERAPNMSGKPVRMPPGTYGGEVGRYSGPNFFDWLFGGGNRPPQSIPPGRSNTGRVSQR